MKILITGTTSGLGKYLYENIPNSRALNRDNADDISNYNSTFDVIIHNAFSPQGANKNNIQDYYKYVNDNLLITKKLVDLKPKKFIYISSGDVYRDEFSVYKYTKLFAESIIENELDNYCVLRCAAMLGKYMRPNTFTKILKEKNPVLTLSKNSKFNYILHSDICDFILEVMKKDIKGNFDFSSSVITLEKVVELLKGNPKYGNYTYIGPPMDNSSIVKLNKKFDKSSEQVINKFINQITNV